MYFLCLIGFCLVCIRSYVGNCDKVNTKVCLEMQACLRSDIRKLEAQSSFPANSIRGSRVGSKGRLVEGIPNACQCLINS